MDLFSTIPTTAAAADAAAEPCRCCCPISSSSSSSSSLLKRKTRLAVAWMMVVLVAWQQGAVVTAAAVSSEIDGIVDIKTDAGVKTSSSSDASALSPFSIVIDGGSTGSRLHVYEFVSETNNDTEELSCIRRGSARANIPLSAFSPHLVFRDLCEAQTDESGGGCVIQNQTALDRRLSEYPALVAAHLLPAFQYAAEVIPPQYYHTTLVTYQATAGMRLLTLDQQEAVYDALYEGLCNDESFVFCAGGAGKSDKSTGFQRKYIQTLSGELEGFYGAVATNYLKGTINARMELVKQDNDNSNGTDSYDGPYGALDMGGSSTQIVFLPAGQSAQTDTDTTICNGQSAQQQNADEMNEPGYCLAHYDDSDGDTATIVEETTSDILHGNDRNVLNADQFFSTSYLSYGVDQFRERLWNTWVEEARQKRETYEHERRNQEHDCGDEGYHQTCPPIEVEGECASNVILNPCAFPGYTLEWDGFMFVGTGQAQECVKQIQRLIPHPTQPVKPDNESTDYAQRLVGGQQHPPLRGKFVAMSLYFFTLDSLRELSSGHPQAHELLNRHWPNPSIQELHDALQGLCGRDWEIDLYPIRNNAHSFTRPDVLPHRCFESVYLVTLLKDGFGFQPESRDITFSFLVDGNEVEWSMGMALALRAEQLELRQQKALKEADVKVQPLVAGDDQDDQHNNPLKQQSLQMKQTEVLDNTKVLSEGIPVDEEGGDNMSQECVHNSVHLMQYVSTINTSSSPDRNTDDDILMGEEVDEPEIESQTPTFLQRVIDQLFSRTSPGSTLS